MPRELGGHPSLLPLPSPQARQDLPPSSGYLALRRHWCCSVLSRSLAACAWGCPGQGPEDHKVATDVGPRGAGVPAVSTEGRLHRHHSLEPFLSFWPEMPVKGLENLIGQRHQFLSALNLEIWGNELETAQLFVPGAL